MKKALIIIGVMVLILIVPVLAMTISPTRELIMGLAPDEAVLQLADRIDENRVNSDSKIAELQSTIDAQKTEIDEQRTKLLEAESDIKNVPSVSTIKNIADNSAYCQTNANKYSSEAYEKRKKIPADIKNMCEQINKGGSNNCDEEFDENIDKLEKYKLEYSAYHQKCD